MGQGEAHLHDCAVSVLVLDNGCAVEAAMMMMMIVVWLYAYHDRS